LKNKDIFVVHRSAIVQSGLNALIYIHQKTSAKVIQNYNDLEVLKTIKKSVIFADASLDSELVKYRAKLLNNDNVVAAIAPNSKHCDYEFPFKEVISLSDTDASVNKKFGRIFPLDSSEESRSILTKREIDVLKNVAQGLSSQDIAEKLFISRHTVITHRKNICHKLGIKTISGLTLFALVNKII
jgi:DNA-binding CsgD family transcriptional regulator